MHRCRRNGSRVSPERPTALDGKQIRAVLASRITRLVNPRGFRRKGNTWVRQHADARLGINLQKSSWDDARTSASFYLNVNVTMGGGVMGQRLDSLCAGRTLGRLLDFDEANTTQVEAAADRLAELIDAHVLPFLERFATRESARQALLGNEYGRLVDSRVGIVMSRYLDVELTSTGWRDVA